MSSRRNLVAAAAIVGLMSGACARGDADAPGQVPAQARKDIVLPVDGQSIDATVPANATFETLLRHQNLPADTIGLLMQAVSAVFNPRELRAHQSYRITRTLDGIFREFRYEIDADRLLSIRAVPGAQTFSAEVITMPKEIKVEALSVEIGKGQSLVGVLEALGENVQLALELADIYGGEVDFNSDLQPGDRLQCVFERATRHGDFVGYGRVRAAVLENGGRRIQAVLFPDADDVPAYYDEDGRSLKRQFLKSPLPFDPRITSRFSYHRLHPVHGDIRAHLGVDLGAPYGTSVKTVASGVVDFVGMNGEAGRMVRVRHSGGYQTAYLHLSAFAPGIHVGSHVAQGDFIGRVGSSGTATGPHLDYRIIKSGTYVDPIAELKKMPKGEPILAGRLPAFAVVRDDVFGQMSTLLAASAAHHAPAASSAR